MHQLKMSVRRTLVSSSVVRVSNLHCLRHFFADAISEFSPRQRDAELDLMSAWHFSEIGRSRMGTFLATVFSTVLLTSK